MLLAPLHEPAAARALADDVFGLMHELYPICRSITGNGVRKTLDAVERWIPLARSEVPSGTPVLDWEVPPEWNIRDAFVADRSGRRLIDFRAHNLHVVNYSIPVRRTMTRAELEPHLHSLPEFPDRIPYRTSYYRETWGFCLRHADRATLGDGPFEVVIDSDLAPGHLTYAESVVPGSSTGEALIYTHVCHPSLANDNLTGIAVAAALARALRTQHPRLTWRFVFGPGTIGSITWLARNEAKLPALRAGFVVGLLGDGGSLTYKRSRRGGTLADRVAEHVLSTAFPATSRCIDFEPYGYDERQFCSPGFDLPVGRLTRSPNATYPEYHSSADDLAFVRADAIAQSISALAQMLALVDANRRVVNLSPKGEPRLGKRGLYRSTGGTAPGEFEHALLWTLSLADGTHDLVAIAARSGMSFALIDQAATALEQAGLLAVVDTPQETKKGTLQ
jgi:aminopeptidase-like protein